MGTAGLGDPGSLSSVTNGSGNYSFTGLWPGDYIVSESWKAGWRQTWPTGFQTHEVWLGPEQNMGSVDFGNVTDTLFSISFRTFSYDSLALGKDRKFKTKPVKAAPNKAAEWNRMRRDTEMPSDQRGLRAAAIATSGTISALTAPRAAHSSGLSWRNSMASLYR